VINEELKSYLEDLTAEENDIKYGYISGANALRVPV
jgi:hypothetical protein